MIILPYYTHTNKPNYQKMSKLSIWKNNTLGHPLFPLFSTLGFYSVLYGSWVYIRDKRIIWYNVCEEGHIDEQPNWRLSYYTKPYRHLVYIKGYGKAFEEKCKTVDESETSWRGIGRERTLSRIRRVESIGCEE